MFRLDWPELPGLPLPKRCFAQPRKLYFAPLGCRRYVGIEAPRQRLLGLGFHLQQNKGAVMFCTVNLRNEPSVRLCTIC